MHNPGIPAQAIHILYGTKEGDFMAREKTLSRAQRLRMGLEETRRDLNAARAGFDQTADGDLLEYYLYQISALRAKHTYLLRQMKSLEKGEGP